MDEQKDNDYEIIESDSYAGTKDAIFSHSQLVMMAMRKCIETGGKEMREGYINEKRDRFGNVMRSYVPDTRLEFIGCVESLKMLVERDFDGEATNNILLIEQWIAKRLAHFCEIEKLEWEKVSPQVKQKWLEKGMLYRQGVLSQPFPYYIDFLMEKVSAYRKIFSELSKLNKRLDDYKEEMLEA